MILSLVDTGVQSGLTERGEPRFISREDRRFLPSDRERCSRASMARSGTRESAYSGFCHETASVGSAPQWMKTPSRLAVWYSSSLGVTRLSVEMASVMGTVCIRKCR
jgi:hypothetical protein